MSAIDGARTLVQDIVVPDFKALSARVDSLESSMKQRFDGAEKLAEARHELMLFRMEAGFATVDARFAALMAAMDARFAIVDARFETLNKNLNTDRRLEILEAKQNKIQ